MTLREYLIANLFDGEDSGTITAPVKGFVDDICENVAIWMADQSGVRDRVETYYTGGDGRVTIVCVWCGESDCRGAFGDQCSWQGPTNVRGLTAIIGSVPNRPEESQ